MLEPGTRPSREARACPEEEVEEAGNQTSVRGEAEGDLRSGREIVRLGTATIGAGIDAGDLGVCLFCQNRKGLCFVGTGMQCLSLRWLPCTLTTSKPSGAKLAVSASQLNRERNVRVFVTSIASTSHLG